MPAGQHNGRTRADRKTLTVPVTAAELAEVDKQARKAGVSRAEFVRTRILGPKYQDRSERHTASENH